MSTEPLPLLDRSTLPPHLAYLVPLAEKYGNIQFPDQIDDFIARGSNVEKDELAALARRLWEESEDGHDAVEWTMRLPLTQSPASARVHFLLTLLTELGLS
jgi:hypothetical protein